MFIAYDPDGLLEDALRPYRTPPLPLVTPRGSSCPQKATPPPLSNAALGGQDFPFLLGDRVRVLDKESHLFGRIGIVTGFIRSLNEQREMMCRVFFSCGTHAGLAASALELDPCSLLVSNDLLDAVVQTPSRKTSSTPRPKGPSPETQP